MAESSINNIVVSQREEETETKVDCRDLDDYSSGSDRSIDDVDNSSRGNSVRNCLKNHSESTKSRRKRRHGSSHGSRRHKGGSRHKQKGYQSYQITEDELQLKRQSLELQEKENAAAVVRNEGAGQFVNFPVAPFNSTQFLMDEHSNCDSTPASVHKSYSTCVLRSCSPEDIRIHSVPSTPVDSNHETITFEKKDTEFTDFFAKAHAENLQSLPKTELVKHYIHLEEKIAALQKKVAHAEHHQRQDEDSYSKCDRHTDILCTCDSICNSDTNSLSSSNEEFVDLTLVTQPSVSCVVESGMISNSEVVSSEDIKENPSDKPS
uniref:Uncharacterized protein n=1 Tax=Arion vulgaris TaxID=1028688 RepID=A0A0B6XYU2_9EUPU